MIRPFFVFLAPLGCLLMLLFTSLTPFRMMSLIGEMMQPESRVSNVTWMAPLGGLGAVMFGLGMMFLTLLRRKPRIVARTLLAFAALLMVVGAASNAFGDWLMMSAFRNLATAESIDSEGFLSSFLSAKIPMLVGYALLLVATTGIAAAATMMTDKGRLARRSVMIGAVSFAALLIMVYWGQASILPFSETLARKSVEPSALAGSINGILLSDFLFQGSVFGFAVSTLLVAVAGGKEQSGD
ncbi:hypothetical protein Enr13x_51660 [Stieleria neptunia]|uniref:Uncharacterized protein n=2 Tax=Stieleria neptunia TaxID=2527979 RepID=A0A518HWQ2_9BACT|nr:hypothetical protein Enr13x_51660 [Stieleria neptunia]